MVIGAPARPFNRDKTYEIARTIAALPEITEAHFPQIAIGASQAAQVLVPVFNDPSAIEPAMQRLTSALTKILPGKVQMDIWPLLESKQQDLIGTVRSAGCRIVDHGAVTVESSRLEIQFQ